MRSRLDLDHGRDPVLLDACHDTRELISRGPRDDRSLAARATSLDHQPTDFVTRDHALTARRTRDGYPALAAPPSDRLHGDAQPLGRFADAHLRVGREFAHMSNIADFVDGCLVIWL
jgi:hypothetical protein